MIVLWGIVFSCISVWDCYLLYELLYICDWIIISLWFNIVFEIFFFYYFSLDYGVDFFKKFTMVMNVFDNRGEGFLLNVFKYSYLVMYL